MDGKEQRQFDRVTRCILLQNPEYVKALNIRKCLILARLEKAADKDNEKGDRDEIVKQELRFTALVLGIPANAKMATLWYHRRWLLSLSCDPRLRTLDADSKTRSIDPVLLPYDILEYEMTLIESSVEKYPRNYMAWTYRQWILAGQMKDAEKRGRKVFWQQEYDKLISHLNRNPGDHSALVYLISLSKVRRRAEGESLQNGTAKEAALDLAKRYTFRETPWLFLRALAIMAGEEEDGTFSSLYEAALEIYERELARINHTSFANANTNTAESQECEQNCKAAYLARRTVYFLGRFSSSTGSTGITKKELCTAEGREVLLAGM